MIVIINPKICLGVSFCLKKIKPRRATLISVPAFQSELASARCFPVLSNT